jgi:hypothetical protein
VKVGSAVSFEAVVNGGIPFFNPRFAWSAKAINQKFISSPPMKQNEPSSQCTFAESSRYLVRCVISQETNPNPFLIVSTYVYAE